MNVTFLEARSGAPSAPAWNTVPSAARAFVDCRVPVTMPMRDVRAKYDAWAAAHGCSWGFVNPKFGQDEYYVPGLVGSTHADAEHHRCTAPGMPHDNNKATAKACL